MEEGGKEGRSQGSVMPRAPVAPRPQCRGTGRASAATRTGKWHHCCPQSHTGPRTSQGAGHMQLSPLQPPTEPKQDITGKAGGRPRSTELAPQPGTSQQGTALLKPQSLRSLRSAIPVTLPVCCLSGVGGEFRSPSPSGGAHCWSCSSDPPSSPLGTLCSSPCKGRLGAILGTRRRVWQRKGH